MTIKRRLFCFGVFAVLAAAISIVVAFYLSLHQDPSETVEVSFAGYTEDQRFLDEDQKRVRCMSFVISNLGPSAIEWDVGQFEWSDLPAPTNFGPAFVMGYSALLRRGESSAYVWPAPTRSGRCRLLLPCRRAESRIERWLGWLPRRHPRLVPAPSRSFQRERRLALSGWVTRDEPLE